MISFATQTILHMINKRVLTGFVFMAVFFAWSFSLSAQNEQLEINKTDEKGRKQGEWKTSYPNGILRYEGFFQDGNPEGIFNYYDSTGQLKARNTFESNGSIAWHQAFADNGFVIAKGKFVEQQKDSIWLYYAEADSLLIASETYKKGLLHGESVTYFSGSEQPAEVLNYSNGRLDGLWIKYFEDGTIQTRATYVDDQLEGEFVTYHPNGEIMLIGQYHQGEKLGTWKTYDEEGNLLNEDVYKPLGQELDVEEW